MMYWPYCKHNAYNTTGKEFIVLIMVSTQSCNETLGPVTINRTKFLNDKLVVLDILYRTGENQERTPLIVTCVSHIQEFPSTGEGQAFRTSGR